MAYIYELAATLNKPHNETDINYFDSSNHDNF